MKGYKTNMGIFIMLPIFIIVLMVTYIIIIFNRSYMYINIINIGIDGIILIYYFVNFSYEIKIDNSWVIFSTAFKKYKVRREEIGFTLSAPFLTKFICKGGNFYILTTPSGGKTLKEMFRDSTKKDG